MSKTVGLTDVISKFIDDFSVGMYTAMPGVVETVHNGGQDLRVDVLPLFNTEFADGTIKEPVSIDNIQIMMPGTLDSMVSFPIKKGTPVLLVFCQRDMSGFRHGNASTYTPEEDRRMSIQDAVAIPGIFPFGLSPNAPTARVLSHSTNDMVVSHNIGTSSECEVRMKPDGTIELTSPIKIKCKSPDMEIESNISVLGNLTQSGGTLSSNGVVLDSHTHGGVDRGSGNTNPPNS